MMSRKTLKFKSALYMYMIRSILFILFENNNINNNNNNKQTILTTYIIIKYPLWLLGNAMSLFLYPDIQFD